MTDRRPGAPWRPPSLSPSLAGRLVIIALLAFGLGRRLYAVSEFRNFAGDGWQYYNLAHEVQSGHRYAFGPAPLPLAWSRLPGYPLLVAAAGIGVPGFSSDGVAVRVTRAQAVLDLGTALLAFLIATELGFLWARYLALLLCVASPFLALCTTYVLSETLAVFWNTLVLWLLVRAARRQLAVHLGIAGALLGLGLLVRADTVTLVPCFVVPLLFTREPLGERARAAVIAGLAAALAFAPWPARNLIRFGAPHPLGSSWVSRLGDPLPTGVQTWLLTWAVDPQAAADVAWKMTRGTPIYGALLPPDATDSPAERKRVTALFDRYNTEGLISAPVDAGFVELARERRKREPIRYFLELPLRRAVELWAKPVPSFELPVIAPSLGLPDSRDKLATLLHRTLGCAALGLLLLAFRRRREALALLTLALVAGAARTVALAFLVAGGTQRYTIELMPLVLVLAAVALVGPAELVYRRLREREVGAPETQPETETETELTLG